MRTVVFAFFLVQAAAFVPSFFNGRPKHGLVDHGARLVHRLAGTQNHLDVVPDYPGLSIFNFTQNVTHFDDTNSDTFQQRYWYNSNYTKNKNIVFLMIQGESEATDRWAGYSGYQYLQMASIHGADVFQLEHRCFGHSRPYNNLEASTLKFCNIDEALDDIATFIRAMNDQYKFINPRWITFGGSYPGFLSATFRATYPELTVGAVASSAPLIYLFDMWHYAWSMQETLKTRIGCAEAIQESFDQLSLLTITTSGRKTLNTKLNLQPPFTNDTTQIEIDNFFENVFSQYQDVIQYTFDGRNDDTMTTRNVDTLCSYAMTNKDPVDKVWDVTKWVRSYDPENNLTIFPNSYSDFITALQNTTFDDENEADGLPNASNRGWLWLQCGQLGVQQTTDQGRNIFGQTVPINYFIRVCKEGFGDDIMSAQQQYDGTNYVRRKWGNGNYKATNVVLPNGSFDPWHKLGFYTPDEQNNVVPIFISGTAHCADMYEEYEGEPEDLKRARKIIYDKVSEFLNDYPDEQ